MKRTRIGKRNPPPVIDLVGSVRAMNLLESLSLRTVSDVRRYLRSHTPTTKRGTWAHIREAISDASIAEYQRRDASVKAAARLRPHEIVLTFWQLGNSDFYPTKDAAQRARERFEKSWKDMYPHYGPPTPKTPKERFITIAQGSWQQCDRATRLLKALGADVILVGDWSADDDEIH